jgi:hypothetical protein
MPQALSSFLVSVSVIIAVVLFIPCIELFMRLLRRGPQGQGTDLQGEAAKVYSREVA